MARYRRIQERRIQRKSLKDPDELMRMLDLRITNLSFKTMNLAKRYSKKKGHERYEELSGISHEADMLKDGIRTLLGNIVELQHQLRIATDEAIEANIKANVFDKPKEKDLNFKNIIKKSCAGLARPVKEEKE